MTLEGQRDEEEAALLARAVPSASFEQEHLLVIEPEELQAARKPPLWAWLLLAAAVLAVSSAAVVFELMADVPPITLAAWRLQLTSVLLGIGAAAQLARMPPGDRARTLRAAPLLAAGGACLAVHFGAWVASLKLTSLTHSLLFVSATPLFLVLLSLALRRPISGGELAGTAVGLAGGVILATAAARADAQVTLAGDMAALLASLCFVGYLLVGRHLRVWMPAFVYAFSVTGLAAALLSLGALLLEGASLAAPGERGVLGWAASGRYLPLVLYLAVGPGIVGHTGFNTLLRYLNPLVISLACNLEPVFGSLLGWAAGVVAAPGPWTLVGGALVLVSTAAVSLASHRREQQQAAAAATAAGAAPAAPRGKDGGGGDGPAEDRGRAASRRSAPAAAAAGAAAAGAAGVSSSSNGLAGRSDSAAAGSWGRLWQQGEPADVGPPRASKPPDGLV